MALIAWQATGRQDVLKREAATIAPPPDLGSLALAWRVTRFGGSPLCVHVTVPGPPENNLRTRNEALIGGKSGNDMRREVR
jgi:hypothetical protein